MDERRLKQQALKLPSAAQLIVNKIVLEANVIGATILHTTLYKTFLKSLFPF
jgi:hypothetical protein